MTRDQNAETLTICRAQELEALTSGRILSATTLTAAGSDSRQTLTGGGGSGALVEKLHWEVGDLVDGKYEVLAELGRGGMGMVYKVHHHEWDLDLAVKMPLASLVADEASKARFVREAQTWVDLGMHPNIVQCWYVRELGGVPRLFMDFMPAGSLKDWISLGRAMHGGWHTIIDLALQVCDGLSYAHEKGVVHRDIKPANLLMTDEGRLCVSDFGLVKVAGTSEIQAGRASSVSSAMPGTSTATGVLMGTPGYGAPEQWTDAKDIDARADVYALGVILFELCCGRRPFDDGLQREPTHVLIGRQLTLTPPAPVDFNPDVPVVLNQTICQCLARNREDRPASILRLRSMLEEAHREIFGTDEFRRTPSASELRADALNNRAVSLWELGERSLALDVWGEALRLDGGHLDSTYNHSLARWRVAHATDLEVRAHLRGVSTTSPQKNLYLGLVDLERGSPAEAEALLRIAIEDPEIDSTTDATGWLALGHALVDQNRLGNAHEAYARAHKTGKGNVPTTAPMPVLSSTALAIPSDHRVLAVASNGTHLLTASKQDRVLHVWNVTTTTCTALIEAVNDERWRDAFTLNGQVAACVRDTAIEVWDLSIPRRIWQHEASRFHAVALTRDGTCMAGLCWDLATKDGFLHVWRLESGERTHLVDGLAGLDVVSLAQLNGVPGCPPVALALVGHKTAVLAHTPAARTAGDLAVWNLAGGWGGPKSTCVLSHAGEPVHSVAVTADGTRLTTLSGNGTLNLWDIATGLLLARYSGVAATALATVDDQHAILAGRGTLRLHELLTGRCLRTIEGGDQSPPTLALDGSCAAMRDSGPNGPIRLWRVPCGNLGRRAPMQVSRPRTISVANDQSRAFELRLATARAACERVSFSEALSALDEARAIPGYTRDPRACDLNASLAERLPRQRIRSGWPIFTVTHAGLIGAAFSAPDERLVLVDTKSIRVFAPRSDECRLKVVHQEGFRPSVMTLDPRGRFLALGGEQTVTVRDLSKGKYLATLKSDREVSALGASPDGTLLAGFRDGTIRRFDLRANVWSAGCQEHTGTVFALVVSSDGKTAISAAADGTVCVWDPQRGRCIRRIEAAAIALAVATKGNFLVIGADAVRICDGTTGILEYAMPTPPFQGTMCTFDDGRYALIGHSEGLVAFDLCRSRAIPLASTIAPNCLATTVGGRWVLSRSSPFSVQLWEIDWEFGPPDWV